MLERMMFRWVMLISAVASRLADRGFEVFRLLGQGLTTREICHRLNLSQTHRLHVRKKLQLRTGPALTKYALHWSETQGMV
jgi:DNA-binding CsgD family transcriptional regulator